ncbi:HDOD domain-containing protein [Desulfatitalea alkaliphila]|uniref:HDOD domain-containing protein n=1 Tax=Desulfatitalea alkaliphila TaxID=2929485 RepID=A0AA41R3Z5_9BACT|nr:HDOD domain-containing protein [Desulfatitalea alkaliphila]MCJ8500351.1 HDOD domain-containing protein [Desulfatitalea alkaliphila]
MIFQGDLSKYHPADALMFMSQLSLNGVLSVAAGQRVLTLVFENGFLVDAHSTAGDDKFVRLLRWEKRIDEAVVERIGRIRSETGMAVRQIVGELDVVPLSDLQSTLETVIEEVLLELFLMETGTFHFTDARVAPDGAAIRLDAGALSIKALSHADEWRNFEKSVISLDREIQWRPADPISAQWPAAWKMVARMAARPLRLQRLLALAPMGSHAALRMVEQQLAAGCCHLLPVPDKAADPVPPAADTGLDPLFTTYKQALKSVMRAPEVVKKVEAVIGFCKNYYRDILIFTARQGQVIHCKRIVIDGHGGMRQQSHKGDLGAVAADPVFDAVCRSGVGFLGKVFPSPLIAALMDPPPGGECALLPVVVQPPLIMFFYACTERTYEGLSPHHYLELLSWMVAPSAQGAPGGAGGAAAGPPGASSGRPDVSTKGTAPALVRMLDRLEELPPLPAMAGRTLELLADPDAGLDQIEPVIACDQALVAKLIKVGNSALYGGVQKVGTLRQALARLGAKTTKSLVLAASARGYFLQDRKGVRAWGQSQWRHSLECGLAARRVAAVAGEVDPEQGFVAGLMHDIGKLAILLLDEEQFKAIQQLRIAEKISEHEAEQRVLGVDHPQLGHHLLERWRMPEPLVGAVRRHHCWAAAETAPRLTAVVALANHLSHILGGRSRPDDFDDPGDIDALRHALGLSEAHQADLLEKVAMDFQNVDLLG